VVEIQFQMPSGEDHPSMFGLRICSPKRRALGVRGPEPFGNGAPDAQPRQSRKIIVDEH
jgi:hypothetical protein